jgi:hypothetical protein
LKHSLHAAAAAAAAVSHLHKTTGLLEVQLPVLYFGCWLLFRSQPLNDVTTLSFDIVPTVSGLVYFM